MKDRFPTVRSAILFLSALLALNGLQAQEFPNGFSQVTVTTGLGAPTALAFADDGRIFITERGGKLRIVKNGTLLKNPCVAVNVNTLGERGLVGVALAPGFPAQPFVYLFYTLADGSRNRISRFTIEGDEAVPGSEIVVLDLDTLGGATIHNGGALRFLPDGTLLAGVGDAAGYGIAQNLDSYHGKLVRIKPDGSIPEGNPFTTGSEQKRRIWAYGLRNPYTIAIHPGNGLIYANDVGNSSWEEINDATEKGKNFGWPYAEGAKDDAKYQDPLLSYPHREGDGNGCAITGGVFYAHSAYPAWYKDKYFYLDYCNQWINAVDPAEERNYAFARGISFNAVCLEVGPDGFLYYLNLSTNSLSKIIYSEQAAPSVVQSPMPAVVPAGRPVTLTAHAIGLSPIQYQWLKDGEAIPGAVTARYRIDSAAAADVGLYQVVVYNGLGRDTSKAALLEVTRPNTRPRAEITSPVAGSLYQAGQTIHFAGEATDEEEGQVSDSLFTWKVDFHHDTHVHYGSAVGVGVKSGSFRIDDTGEPSANVWYRLYLMVSDREGLTDTTFVDIHPQVATVRVATQPEGLLLTLDDQTFETPGSIEVVSGFTRKIGAVSTQTRNDTIYLFDHWTHGGGQEQSVPLSLHQQYQAVFRVFRVNGVENFYQQAFALYPNPAREDLYLRVYVAEPQEVSLQISNPYGGLTERSVSLAKAGENVIRLPVNGMSGGIYTLRLAAREGIITRRFTVLPGR